MNTTTHQLGGDQWLVRCRTGTEPGYDSVSVWITAFPVLSPNVEYLGSGTIAGQTAVVIPDSITVLSLCVVQNILFADLSNKVISTFLISEYECMNASTDAGTALSDCLIANHWLI
jgi:hypothetical protein